MKTGTAGYTPSAEYSALRLRVLRNSTAGDEGSVTRGLLVETGYAEAVVTLVALEDGTASLHFSNGGGGAGRGLQELPTVAARSLVAFTEHALSHLSSTTSYPLPRPGHARFYLIRSDGVHTAEVREDHLRDNRHALSPLFHAARELIEDIED
jgi:hypothetical protein